MGFSAVFSPAARRHDAKHTRLTAVCGATVLAGALACVAQPSEATGLRQVIEQAKKPVEEQDAVTRTTSHREVVASGGVEALWVPVGVAAYPACSYWAPPPPAASVYYEDVAYRDAGVPQGPGIDAWHVGFKSLHMRPADGVLAGLGGAGIELGLSASGVRADLGLYWLEGRVRESSPVYGGIAHPAEFAIDGRVRSPASRTLGINGFVGLRFGHLTWDYANPVFAIDQYGYGEEIWDDSLNNISAYCGVGLRPFETRSFAFGLDLGAGWRTYMGHTGEEFRNDVFENGWFPQASFDVALTF